MLQNPESPAFVSIVPVKFATSIDIKRNATGEHTSNIMPIIDATKIIIMCRAFSDKPEEGSKNIQAIVDIASIASNLKIFISLLKNDSFMNLKTKALSQTSKTETPITIWYHLGTGIAREKFSSFKLRILHYGDYLLNSNQMRLRFQHIG